MGRWKGNLVIGRRPVPLDELADPDQIVQHIANAEIHIERLELALYRIVGHGNITGDKARTIAAEALGIQKPEQERLS